MIYNLHSLLILIVVHITVSVTIISISFFFIGNMNLEMSRITVWVNSLFLDGNNTYTSKFYFNKTKNCLMKLLNHDLNVFNLCYLPQVI